MELLHVVVIAPKECIKTNFHHLKLVEINATSQTARFEQLMVTVKYFKSPPELPKKVNSLVHVLFQSTDT